MEHRKSKIMFAKNGQGFRTTRMTIPVPWIDKLGVTEDDREVDIYLINNQIIISKEVMKMKIISQLHEGKRVWCVVGTAITNSDDTIKKSDYVSNKLIEKGLPNGMIVFLGKDDGKGKGYIGGSLEGAALVQRGNLDLLGLIETIEKDGIEI